MAWTSPAPPPPAPGWWNELSFDRWVAGVVDEMQAEMRAEWIEQLHRDRGASLMGFTEALRVGGRLPGSRRNTSREW